MYSTKKILHSIAVSVSVFGAYGRSIHRPIDPYVPVITTRWNASDLQSYSLRDSHLLEYTLFEKFDPDHFFSLLLPQKLIPFRRDPTCMVSGKHLMDLLEELVTDLQTLRSKKNTFKNFIVLKQRDFNPVDHSGNIILKFKDYPFVVKIFMETPETFVNPFSKGIEPSCFFIMGSANRYLSGFLRIKNLYAIREHLAASPYWSERVDLPRKWFWQPKDNRWFELKGENFAGKTRSMMLPSLYAIVSDFIEGDRTFTIFDGKNRHEARRLCHFLGSQIDPHIDNFIYEKSTGKIVIIDTEHFPTMVGLDKPLEFSSYLSLYCQLSWKCFKDKFCRSKVERRRIQQQNEFFSV
jgi:hypothetical protein